MLKDTESVRIRNSVGFIDSENPFPVSSVNCLIPERYDYIELEYDADILTTIIYKIGGSEGTVVATLTLGYTGDNLTSIIKT